MGNSAGADHVAQVLLVVTLIFEPAGILTVAKSTVMHSFVVLTVLPSGNVKLHELAPAVAGTQYTVLKSGPKA